MYQIIDARGGEDLIYIIPTDLLLGGPRPSASRPRLPSPTVAIPDVDGRSFSVMTRAFGVVRRAHSRCARLVDDARRTGGRRSNAYTTHTNGTRTEFRVPDLLNYSSLGAALGTRDDRFTADARPDRLKTSAAAGSFPLISTRRRVDRVRCKKRYAAAVVADESF